MKANKKNAIGGAIFFGNIWPKISWEIDVCQHRAPLAVKRINDTKIEVEGVMEFRRFHCGESSVAAMPHASRALEQEESGAQGWCLYSSTIPISQKRLFRNPVYVLPRLPALMARSCLGQVHHLRARPCLGSCCSAAAAGRV